MALPVPTLISIPATRLAVGTIRTYGLGFLVYGLAVITQGPERWSGPQYATVTAIAPQELWGAVIASLGMLILIGSFTRQFVVRNIGLYGGALWIGTFATATLNVAAHDPHVSYTGSIIYATLGVAMCWVARAREVPFDAGFPPRV